MDHTTHPKRLLLIAGFFFTLAVFLFSLKVGKYPLILSEVAAAGSMARQVFLTLRLPRALLGLLGGFGLGVAGSVYQTVFRNPLASPDIIGVSSGASAGAALAILFWSAAPFTVTLSAFGGAVLAVLLSLGLSSLAPRGGNSSVVLAGIAVQALTQTLLMALKLIADPEKELASIEYWIMGGLNGVTSHKLPFPLAVCLLCTFLLFILHRQVLLLSVEADEARLLGVSVGRLRLICLLLATLATACVISVTGPISFIGLLAPHIARLLTRDNRLSTLCLSGLMGSLLLLIADLLARSVTANELPVSIFTSLLGAPFLLYLLVRRERQL